MSIGVVLWAVSLYGLYYLLERFVQVWVSVLVFEIVWIAMWVIYALLFFILPNVVYSKQMRIRVRQQLQKQGIKVCMYCGYDLRGQEDPRCPECGTVFNPGLISPEKHDDEILRRNLP